MRIEITLPNLGDDDDAVHGGTVALWHAQEGAVLREGDDLLEINTDKAAFVVPAPQGGTLVERRVQEGESVAVGEVVGILQV